MLKGHKEGCILYHPETNRETVKETTLDAHRCRPEMFPGRVKRVKKKKKANKKEGSKKGMMKARPSSRQSGHASHAPGVFFLIRTAPGPGHV